MIVITIEGTKHEFDEARLMMSEAIAIRKVSGMGPERIFSGLRSRSCTPETCSDWDGDDPCDLDEHKRDMDPESMKVLVWLAVRREGGEVPRYSDFDFNLADIDIEQVSEPEPEQQTEDEAPDPTTVATLSAT